LYLGNNSDATGTVFLRHQGKVPTDFNAGITDHFRPLIGELQKLNEHEQDLFLKERFLDFVRSEPGRFLRLLAVKAYYFAWFNGYERTPWLFV
jgi:hypothetical protein